MCEDNNFNTCIKISNNYLLFSHYVVSQLFAAPWTATCQASLSFTISWSSLKLIGSMLICISEKRNTDDTEKKKSYKKISSK